MIDIEISEGYVVVNASVNSRFTGRFLLDTGADVTVVSTAIARALDLQTVRYHESGVAGGKTLRVPLARLDAFSIDGRIVSPDPVAIVDVGDVHGPFGKVDGIVGSDYLKEFPLTIDYAGAKLIFEDSASLEKRRASGSSVSLLLRNGITPFVAVRLNDTMEREYKLDTGAAMTHVPLHDMAALGMNPGDPGLTPIEASGLGGNYTAFRGCLDCLSLGPDLEIAHIPVRSYETEYGFVGADYLRNFAVTLDYKGARVILSRSANAGQPA